MNEKIADILKDTIQGLSFVDKITGLIQVGYLTQGEVMKKTEFKFNELEQIKVPISLSTYPNYDLYYPDKNKKSVIFFEDDGVSLESQDRGQMNYKASLKLVCWFNKKKIDPNITRNDLIQNINYLLIGEQPNTTDFNRIYVEFKGQETHSESIYSKYDLDIGMYQYMLYPYDLFSLSYDVYFTVTCINEIELNPQTC